MFISIYLFPPTPFRRRIGSNNKENQQPISHPVTYNISIIKTTQFQQTTSIYSNYCHSVTNKSQNFKSWTQSSILSRISENSTKATPTLTPDQTKWNLIKGPPTRTPDQNFNLRAQALLITDSAYTGSNGPRQTDGHLLLQQLNISQTHISGQQSTN